MPRLRCLLPLLLSVVIQAQTLPANPHADPLNFDPSVRQAYGFFYNLDYDRALSLFDKVLAAHPDEPLAYAEDEMVVIFRELYHQDLLDTTYYARDSFLTNQRRVDVPQPIRERIEYLNDKTASVAEQHLKTNPQDKNALFARGYARGLHAAFITLVDHSFFSAARQGLAARNDSEAVLKVDPEYADADMAIGIQQFAVASLPRFVRLAVGIAGVGGNKERGLDLLRNSAAHGVVTNVESRTVLSLFLRHDARYPEALEVQHGLAIQFPHDYLFRLEEANLAKDEGNASLAIATYKVVLTDAGKTGYFIDPRLQLAYFGLADTERGQNNIKDAAEHYAAAANQPNCSDWLRKRANLNAGEMLDLLGDRQGAIDHYRRAGASGGDQTQASAARKLLDKPYEGK